MADEHEVRQEIAEIIHGEFSNWEIGITDAQNQKQDSDENMHQWYFSATDLARQIKMDYLEIGCKEASESGDRGQILYIKRAM